MGKGIFPGKEDSVSKLQSEAKCLPGSMLDCTAQDTAARNHSGEEAGMRGTGVGRLLIGSLVIW